MNIRGRAIMHECAPLGVLLDELHQRRLALGLTQGAVAEAVGVRTNTLGCWESGCAVPALPAFLRWAGVLGRRVQLADGGTLRLVETPPPAAAEQRFAEALGGRRFERSAGA